MRRPRSSLVARCQFGCQTLATTKCPAVFGERSRVVINGALERRDASTAVTLLDRGGVRFEGRDDCVGVDGRGRNKTEAFGKHLLSSHLGSSEKVRAPTRDGQGS